MFITATLKEVDELMAVALRSLQAGYDRPRNAAWCGVSLDMLIAQIRTSLPVAAADGG